MEENKKSLKEIIYEIKGSNEKEWHYLAHTRILYTDKITTEKEYTFIECYNLIKEGKEDFDFYPIYTNTTLFKKEPRICFYDLLSSAFTQKQMGNKIVLRERAVDRSYATMQQLMNEMEQQDFIEYLKDKGVNCPLLCK